MSFPPLYSTMITPKLTAVLVAMTALFGYAPVAALAQSETVFELEICDQLNAAEVSVETGRNTQVNNQEQVQVADNDVTISNEATSGDAEGGDANAEASAESGDAKGKKSKSSAEASAVAVGGDARSGDAIAVQTLENVEIDNEVEQTAVQTNEQDIEDQDDVNVEIDQENEAENENEGNVGGGNGDGDGDGLTDLIECLLLPPGQIRACVEGLLDE